MGVWNVPELMRLMPSSLFGRWMAFDRIEPISLGWRGDHQAGVVASLLANIHRDARKRSEAFSAADFIPQFGQSRTGQSEIRSKPMTRRKMSKELYQGFRDWAVLSGAAPGVKQ